MKYFFDNTFPPAMVKILSHLAVEAVHLQDKFPADTPDIDWIPKVGQEGYVIVTGDARINKHPAEKSALQAANVIAVFMERGFTSRKIFDQVAHVITCWPTIDEKVRRVKPGACLKVTVNKRVEIM